MFKFLLNNMASSTDDVDEYIEGIKTVSTFSLPNACTTIAMVTAESIPPEEPIIAFLKFIFLK